MTTKENIISVLKTHKKPKHSSEDSLLRKTIERVIRFPDCIDCDYTGITLIQVFKSDDSIKIKSLYSSGNGYNFENDKKCKMY